MNDVVHPDSEPRWYACYTRARHEKRVDAMLQERGVESFLPLVPRKMKWKDRFKTVDWPMFPSYIFGRFPLVEAHQVLSIPGVAMLVKAGNRPVPIADDELEDVRRLVRALQTGQVEAEHRPFFAQGQRVQVTNGPLEGTHGVVLESRGGRVRLMVGLRAIGQGMEVNVDAKALRAVSDSGEH